MDRDCSIVGKVERWNGGTDLLCSSVSLVRHEASFGQLVKVQSVKLSVQTEAKKMVVAVRQRSKLFLAVSKP